MSGHLSQSSLLKALDIEMCCDSAVEQLGTHDVQLFWERECPATHLCLTALS